MGDLAGERIANVIRAGVTVVNLGDVPGSRVTAVEVRIVIRGVTTRVGGLTAIIVSARAAIIAWRIAGQATARFARRA